MRVSDGSRWLRVSGFEVFQGVGLSFLLGSFSTGWLVSRREGLWDLQLTGIRLHHARALGISAQRPGVTGRM